MRRYLVGAVVMVLGVVATASASPITLDVPSDGTLWNGPSEGGFETVGQTFTVPLGSTVLDGFSFWLGPTSSGPLHFAAYLMAWDGNRGTGPLLYKSDARNVPLGTGIIQFDFLTGGLALTAGGQYVAFLSASEYFDGQVSYGQIAVSNGDVYSGGQHVLLNNGTDIAAWSRDRWETSYADTQLRLVFSTPTVPEPTPVTEPATLSLLGCGVAALVERRRRVRAAGRAPDMVIDHPAVRP